MESGDLPLAAGGFTESIFSLIACALVSACGHLSWSLSAIVHQYGDSSSPQGAYTGTPTSLGGAAQSFPATPSAVGGPSASAAANAPTLPAPIPPLPDKGCYKPFTKANYRANLICYTGNEPAKSQAHHIFPQTYEDWFQVVCTPKSEPG